MDLLISAQSSDSFENLESDFKVEKILQILRSEKNEDLKIRICDRICVLLYQDSSFGLLKQIGNANRVILEYCRELCKNWIDRLDDFKNSNDDWLAGTEISFFALERIFSSWLIICDLLSIDGVKAIRIFEKCYNSTLEFCQKLLNNDERCLTTTVLLLPYQEILGKTSMFYAPLIVFSIFGLIENDTEVIIDWLGSELVTISMFLRILKMIGKNVDDWKGLSGEQRFSIPTPSSITYQSSCSPKLSLKIIEKIGDTISPPKLVEISRKKSVQLPPSLCYINYSTSFTSFQAMLKNLAEKLEKLQKRHLVPENYTTLINYCRRVADL